MIFLHTAPAGIHIAPIIADDLLSHEWGRRQITGECFSSDTGDRTMPEHVKEDSYDEEMASLGKIFNGFLLGVGAIISLWFLSGLLYVILK